MARGPCSSFDPRRRNGGSIRLAWLLAVAQPVRRWPWIALHDDLADPSSNDSVSRLSTRVACASPHSGTAGLDSAYFQKQAGVSRQGAALWQLFGAASQADFDVPAKQSLARDASPLSHASNDDPPLFLTYQGNPSEAPFAAEAAQSNWIHHVCLGLPLKSKYDALGREC